MCPHFCARKSFIPAKSCQNCIPIMDQHLIKCEWFITHNVPLCIRHICICMKKRRLIHSRKKFGERATGGGYKQSLLGDDFAVDLPSLEIPIVSISSCLNYQSVIYLRCLESMLNLLSRPQTYVPTHSLANKIMI